MAIFQFRLNQYSLNLFPFASGINAVVNKLNELNHKSVTWWGERDKANDGWTGVSGEDGIPLNIYASANPRFASDCTTNAEVICARNLVADLDKTTLPEALAKLKASGLPQPSITVLSGHGVHFYWRLNKPITNLARWTAIQKRLIQLLGSDPAIHDPARVMRVPGFLNVNGDTPVACRIHEADPERRYDLKELLSYLPPLPPEPPKPDRPARTLHSTDTFSRSLSDSSIIKRATAFADHFEPVNEDRNVTLFNRSCDLADKFGLTETEILPLIKENNSKSSNPLAASEVEEIVKKAVNHIRKKGKQRGTLLQPPSRFEKFVEPSGLVIALPVWREEMKNARLNSLNHPGEIFLDGSTTGAGKSTADIEAMKRTGKSATYVPTHDACGDLVKKLRKEGLSAAAHPKLDENSCQKYGTENKPGTARKALSAGLNVGTCICTTCEFSKTCKFQKQREEARNADHTVATHDRAALSHFTPSKGKPITFIHETPINLLRPMAKVIRVAKKKDVAQLRHLQDIALMAQVAEQVAVRWADDDARNFANRLQRSAIELVAVLTAPDLIQPLEDAAEKGHSTKNLPTVMPLPMNASFPRHKNMDVLLKRAMDQTGLLAKGEVLRLVVGYACGELHQLCAVVDESKGPKGMKIFTKGIVAVWKTDLPTDSVVWFEDASSNATFLKELVGRDVIDKTPQGRLAFTKPPIQFADQDVTKSTSGKTVRAIIRGLLASYSSAKNVGIITHQVHKKEIDRLAPLWQQRISKVEHFHSGKDRASNEWLDCDLILVLGTPRVNASAIRDSLIRIGRIEDAKVNGDFSSLIWEGKTIEGKVISVNGLGYANPSWQELNTTFVKETLRQAIGRGRAVTDKSVQVVVVTNESIGMTLASQPLPLVDDSGDETLHLAIKLTETNPIYIIIGKGSVAPVTTSHITAINGMSDRIIRHHFTSLTSTGLLTKKGERQGVTVPDWLLAYYSQSKAHCGSPLNEEG